MMKRNPITFCRNNKMPQYKGTSIIYNNTFIRMVDNRVISHAYRCVYYYIYSPFFRSSGIHFSMPSSVHIDNLYGGARWKEGF